MFVRFELMYMLPMRMPSIIDTPSPRAAAVRRHLGAGLIAEHAADVRVADARTAGTSAAIWIHEPPEGSSLNASAVTDRVCAADWMSTIGLSPVTVMVSSTAPTRSSASMLAVKLADTSHAFAPDGAEARQRERHGVDARGAG